MASKMKHYAVEKVFELLANDCGTELCVQDSSSDDDDLIQADNIYDDDSQHEILLLEGVTDENHQPPGSPTRSSQPTSDNIDFQPPQRIRLKRKAGQRKDVAKIRRLTSPDEEVGMWHGKDEEDRNPDPIRFTPARAPGPTFDKTAAWSPLSLFQLFFSTSVVRTLIANTNANAAKKKEAGQKFQWTALTESDFYIFLAIIVFTGLVGVRHRSDYWKKDWPYNFHFPRKNMSRNRFEAILWSLHLSNPKDDIENDKKKGTPEYDRLFKIRPLYDQIVTACKANFQPYKNICVDERIVGSRAKTSMKQYTKDKPAKWGFKLFVLADSSTGYTWNFSVYTGKSGSSKDESSFSFVDLLPFSLLGGGYTLYVDNCDSSPALFRHLYKNHIGCCGTIRKNQTDFPRTEQNDFPEEAERGDVRWIRQDELLFVKWVDTREVTMCSTVHKAFSGKTVQRKVKEAGAWKTLDVPVPDAVLDYCKNMSGVDLSDALIGYYSVHHKTMKWYKTFFYHFMDTTIANSFVLYKELCQSRAVPAYTQKKFREHLAAEMLAFAGSAAQSPAPAPTLTCMPRYYGSDASQSRRYCRRCQEAGIQRVKTPVYCRSCNVPLCLTSKKNCFEQWHDKNKSVL